MTSLETLKQGFQAMNVTLQDEVLQKCEELCKRYDLEPDDFLDEWLAYTASNLNGAPPTLEDLDKMERKELQKAPKQVHVSPQPGFSGINSRDTSVLEQSVHDDLSNLDSVSEKWIPVEEVASQVFFEREDSLSVQCSFGDCKITDFKNRTTGDFIIKIHNEALGKELYMYEKLQKKRDAINFNTRWIAGGITNYYELELSDRKFDESYGEMVICGRVYSEFDGKLHVHSLILEGPWELYKGESIKLSVDNLQKYSLFSGQIVVVEGYNFRKEFKASKIYYGIPLPLPEKTDNLEETLEIVVAAGPYTMAENLFYEPLGELLKYVAEHKPNLLFLMGPFVEGNHKIMYTECYDDFFEKLVAGIMEELKGTGTKVILVPSEKDIHNHPIFPTPQFNLERHHENLICASSPFILDVNGLVIGGSSTDILFHLNNAEISRGVYGKGYDKMSHLFTQIINQRNFYPLYPPEVSLDYGLFDKYAILENLPHVMFMPSMLGGFVRNVDGCVVVNPHRLSKGSVGGTFARVEVRPGNGPVSDRVSCQILRV